MFCTFVKYILLYSPLFSFHCFWILYSNSLYCLCLIKNSNTYSSSCGCQYAVHYSLCHGSLKRGFYRNLVNRVVSYFFAIRFRFSPSSLQKCCKKSEGVQRSKEDDCLATWYRLNQVGDHGMMQVCLIAIAITEYAYGFCLSIRHDTAAFLFQSWFSLSMWSSKFSFLIAQVMGQPKAIFNFFVPEICFIFLFCSQARVAAIICAHLFLHFQVEVY